PAVAPALQIDRRAVVGLKEIARVEVDHAVGAHQGKIPAAHGDHSPLDARAFERALRRPDAGPGRAQARRLEVDRPREIYADREREFETRGERVFGWRRRGHRGVPVARHAQLTAGTTGNVL